MIALAGEIADGMVFANGARSHMAASLAALPAAKRDDPAFFIGNMIPTCISDDVEAAKAVNRKTLTRYALLPNYRNYWKEAGYVEEMEAVERAAAEKRLDDVPQYLSDRWLADCTLFGPAARVREGLEAWYAAGITHAHHRAVIGRRQSDEGVRGAVRRPGVVRRAPAVTVPCSSSTTAALRLRCSGRCDRAAIAGTFRCGPLGSPGATGIVRSC